jgi:hypothetical protein
MLIKALLSALLFHQSIGYLQQSICSDSTFGKCPIRAYCGITDTGEHKCLPCPSGKLCPGDGYTYLAQQQNSYNHNTAKYIIQTSNNSFIVSSDPVNRILFRKKLKRIVKIAKVGLKVAVIAKTGGTAGLMQIAAAKAKQLAIKKGLQCLRNGLSNFCNGKKKGAKPKPKFKPRIGSVGGLVKKTKPAAISQNNLRKRVKRTASKPSKNVTKTKPSKTSKKKTKSLGKRTRSPRGVKNLRSKPPSSNGDSSKHPGPCSNIFDDIANKVNNVTNNVVKNPVNKGRDWLKNNIGGNRGNCNQSSLKRRPTNLRGQTKNSKTKTKPKPKPTSTSLTKRRPTRTKFAPRSRMPISNDDATNSPISNDDSTSNPSPVIKSNPKPKAKSIKTRPPSTDDSRQTIRPTQISTDDNNPTIKPSRIRVRKTKIPIRTPTRTPSQTFVVTDDGIPTPKPSRRRVRRTRRPSASILTNDVTALPSSMSTTRKSIMVKTNRPTKTPTKTPTRTPTRRQSLGPTPAPTPVPSRSPTVIPTPVTSRSPTARPSRAPTVHPTTIAGPPTMIPGNGLSWAVFSSTPSIQSNIPPTWVPSVTMFKIATSPPTSVSTPRPSILPTSLKAITQQVSPTQRPTTQRPTTQIPSVQPTITPSFRSNLNPTEIPTRESITTLNPTTATGVSSISSASNSQTGVSNTTIGVAIGCIVLVIAACIFAARKSSKEKLSPYQIWTRHYSSKNQQTQHLNENVINHPPINVKEDIHHFYNKSHRPSFNQNTVFTPHVSGRISSRNSQIVSPIGSQKNRQRLSFTTGQALHNI